MIENFPVVGLIRFSFFGPTDTRQKHSHPDALAELYDPARLEVRFRFFEQVTLPSLQAQTDPDFQVLVITSAVMPAPYLARLTALVAPVPQITLHVADSQDFQKEVTPALQAQCQASPTGSIAAFRLDDDDAIGCSYIDHIRGLARDLPVKTCVTLPSSLSAFREQDGTLGLVERQVFCTGAGLVRILSADFLRTPIATMHGKVWKRFLTVSDPQVVSNLVCYHTHNDTIDNRARQIERFKKDIAPQTLQRQRYWDRLHGVLETHFPHLSFAQLADLLGADLTTRQIQASD
jgi:hypothetical protein